ncbi:MAG TPA: TetR/AcrR family transcriptional regulator [Nocardioides sp.]|jgi:AcrR family transcriptional regulator|nr:TetR/AcrR family transcriptional regulator [Nocardioides sp.]
MSTHQRKERERAERERLIVTTARDLAESEGWDAVTTRRLAAEIEYSQPVLYSHFSGKVAIMVAVAVAGFSELADQLHAARTSATGSHQALTAVARAYAGFARERPAQYEAMFTTTLDLPFASLDAPAPLHRAFAEIRHALEPFTGEDDLETLTETFWAALHGLLTLLHNGRLRRDEHTRRLTLLIKHFAR